MNRKQEQEVQTQIRIIGNLPRVSLKIKNNMKFIDFAQNKKNNTLNIRNKQTINPIKIYSQNNVIAAIDESFNAWLISESFQEPFNISTLLKRKIYNIFLDQKEMIAETEKGYILVNWGAKKLLQSINLMKINIYPPPQFQHYFEAYIILNSTSEDYFHFSPLKKIENNNKLYFITEKRLTLISYPIMEIKKFKQKIKGVSIGTYHCLCWSQIGEIYSWGCQSLALGLGQLPSQNFIDNPQRVKLRSYVLAAYASNHYSLALTSEGKIYEWGIKKQVNQINEEPIFSPRELIFQYYNCHKRFISLKGRYSNYGIVSSDGQLYVWGQNAKPLIDQSLILPISWTGDYLYEPVLQTNFINNKIIDFQIENDYLVVIISNKESSFSFNKQNEYWDKIKQKAKDQLVKHKMMRVNTDNSQVQQLKKKYKNPILNYKQNKTERQNIKISKNKTTNHAKKESQNLSASKSKNINLIQNFKKTAPVQQNMRNSQTSNNVFIHKRQVSEAMQKFMNFNQRDKYLQKFTRNSQLNSFQHEFMKSSFFKNRISAISTEKQDQKKFSETYSFKLTEILNKRKNLQIETMAENLRRIEQNTLQYRIKKKKQFEVRRKQQQSYKLLKSTLCPFLFKHFIIRFTMEASRQGRNLKIQNFARHLILERVQRIIRTLFMKKRIQFSIKQLRKKKLAQFLFLVCYFKQYVKKFRKRKLIRMRKLIVQTLTKKKIQEKIKIGLIVTQLNIRKIQKVKDWLRLIKRQRQKCLKQLWKSFLLISFGRQNQQGSANLKHSEDLSFEQLYSEKMKINPLLKLSNFINNYAIFKIKRYYFKDISALFNLKKSINFNIQQKGDILQIRKKGHICFQGKLNIKQSITSSQKQRQKYVRDQILPYSLHFNNFKKPRNLDLNISDAMKFNSAWIEIERNILQELISSIIKNHDNEYLLKKRKYDIEFATFIKHRYDSFSEKRWKYIIEYNKVEKTQSKLKKEKQLRRLLSLIGMQKLLDQDCIPQKHLILDEASKRTNCPKQPNPYINFDYNEFKVYLKSYYDTISNKAKLIKKKII